MNNKAIFKILELSTGHMRYVDAFYLDKLKDGKPRSPERPFVTYMEYGYLFFSLDPADTEHTLAKLPYSSDLIRVLTAAHHSKCKYVHFDADAPVFEKLFPIFDW